MWWVWFPAMQVTGLTSDKEIEHVSHGGRRPLAAGWPRGHWVGARLVLWVMLARLCVDPRRGDVGLAEKGCARNMGEKDMEPVAGGQEAATLSLKDGAQQYQTKRAPVSARMSRGGTAASQLPTCCQCLELPLRRVFSPELKAKSIGLMTQ